jgi:CRISPR-associated protein Cas4
MQEMGYEVKNLKFYSMIDNKSYPIKLPEDNPTMLEKFETTIDDIKNFNIDKFVQDNAEKCKNCIYEPACDRGLK